MKKLLLVAVLLALPSTVFAASCNQVGTQNQYCGTPNGAGGSSTLQDAAAATKTDDTNVTMTLGGSPTIALLQPFSMTLGWTGQLAVGRGGTGIGSGTSGGIPYFNSTSTMASSGLLTSNGVLLGGGAGASPTATAAGTSAQLLLGQAGAPTWNTMSGDVTIGNTGVTAIGANKVTLGMLNTLAAHSVIGNTTGSTATPTAVPTSTFIQSITVQVFTAGGTYTPTSGMVYAIVECQGSGAGGGGAAGGAGVGGAGGGGAGAYARVRVTAAQIGASKTVTIGAAGAGGTAGNNNGSNGATTSLGTLCTADGGTGGTGSANNAGNNFGAAGPGGSTGTGDIVIAGTAGGVGFSLVNFGYGAYGGSSKFGAGGYGVVGVAGSNATGYGSGGSGAAAGATNTAGGNGSAGAVVVTEFNAL